jgi:hypothetical protein
MFSGDYLPVLERDLGALRRDLDLTESKTLMNLNPSVKG